MKRNGSQLEKGAADIPAIDNCSASFDNTSMEIQVGSGPDIGSLTEEREAENREIIKATAREREWWPAATRFLSREEANGSLVPVPHEGTYYQLIGTLRRGSAENGEPDELRPEARVMLEQISDEWALSMKQHGFSPEGIRLAVTSLYRDETLQRSLTQGNGGYLAAPPQESSHLAGASFDISPTSYYLINEDGTYKGIQQANDQSGTYSPEVGRVLQSVLEKKAEAEKVNFVVEHKVIEDNGIKKVPTVFHICVNPLLA
jgi:hypothetical protein